MQTITIEVPDEVATRLKPWQQELPAVLTTMVEVWAKPIKPTVSPTLTELLTLLLSQPTPQKIMCFKVSSRTQARVDDLLDKNREIGLTDEESAELDGYEQLNFVMVLLKAQARLMLN